MTYDPKAHGARCDECPCSGRPFVPPELRPDAKFLAVGMEPGDTETREGFPFVPWAPSGALMMTALEKCGLQRSDVSITNARLCQTDKTMRDADKAAADECCWPRLQTEIENSRGVLALGANAFAALQRLRSTERGAGHGEAGLTAMRGFPINVTLEDDRRLPALATYHPAFVLRGRRWTGTLHSDIRKMLRHLEGRLDWIEPEVFLNPTIDELDAVLSRFQPGEPVAVDVETAPIVSGDFPDPLDCYLRCVGLANARVGVVVTWRSIDGRPGHYQAADEPRSRPTRLDPARARERLANFFDRVANAPRGTAPRLCGHNIQTYDRPILRRYGMNLPPRERVFDTLPAHRIVESELPHGLGYLSSRFTDMPKHKPGGGHDAWPSDEELSAYCLLDVVCTARLAPFMLEQLLAGQYGELYKIDSVKQRFCEGLHEVGMLVDNGERRRHAVRLAKTAVVSQHAARKAAAAGVEAVGGSSAVIARILDTSDEGLNLGSVQQLRELLYVDLRLPEPSVRTKGGDDPSTSKDAIYELLEQQPIRPVQEFLDALLDWRRAEKFLSTSVGAEVSAFGDVRWTSALRLDAHGRVHPSFNSTSVVTGRLSCSNPNVQNIPSTKEDPDSVRSMYVAGPGNLLVGADMEQLELRLIAAIAGVSKWLEALTKTGSDGKKLDIHRVNAALFYDTAYDKVEDWMRSFAKTFVYMIVYRGGFMRALMQMRRLRDPKTGARPYANMTPIEAKTFRKKLLKGLPELPAWWTKTDDEFRTQRVIHDLIHRRPRYFLDAGDGEADDEVKTETVAFRISATGRAMVDRAIVRLVDNELPWGVYGPGLNHDGHDSLMAEVHARHAPRVATLFEESMSSELLGLPFPSKAKIGPRWSALE